MSENTTSSVQVKVCTKCLGEYPPTAEFFPPHKQGKAGLNPRCRACHYGEVKKRQQRLQRLGVCYTCGKADALPDGNRCGPCTEAVLSSVKRCKAKRKKKGYCVDCGETFAAVGSSRCLTCQARRRDMESALRTRASENGLCALCKMNPPAEHALRCTQCLDKMREACDRRRKRLKKLGLCKDCGRVPRMVGLSTCEKCHTQFTTYIQRLKRETFLAYGGQCACCGESNFGFLTIDHVNNDGYLDRLPSGGRVSGQILYKKLRDLGYPRESYQLLCWNCNLGKHHHHGTCPHKE